MATTFLSSSPEARTIPENRAYSNCGYVVEIRWNKGIVTAKPEAQDPAIAIPLLDQGLLHILEPEQIVWASDPPKRANSK